MDLDQLRVLAGITHQGGWHPVSTAVSNISMTGNEKAQIQRDQNIRPGTDAWFRLWYARPQLTGEKPI